MLVHGLWDWFAFGGYISGLLWVPFLFILSICMVVVPIRQGAQRPRGGSLVTDFSNPLQNPAVPPTSSTVMGTIPPGAHPGQQLYVNLPDGRQVVIVIPMGV